MKSTPEKNIKEYSCPVARSIERKYAEAFRLPGKIKHGKYRVAGKEILKTGKVGNWFRPIHRSMYPSPKKLPPQSGGFAHP